MGVPEHEIAVVTPYQAQVSLISEMIHEEYPTMTIGSVDGLQGQEREVCYFLSTSRSHSFVQQNSTCLCADPWTTGSDTDFGTEQYYCRSWILGRVPPSKRRHDPCETAIGEWSGPLLPPRVK